MVAMFDDILINDEIIENKWITVTPNEKEDSDIFTFDKATGGGRIIKFDEMHMLADIAIKHDGNVLDAMTIIDYMPNPLESFWKTVDILANEIATSNSHTDSLYVSDILSRLYVSNQKAKDLAGCTLGWRNTPGQENYLSNLTTANRTSTFTNNKPAAQRIDSIVTKESVYFIDNVKFSYYMAGPQYVPLNNRLTVKFTKDSSRRIFTGHEYERSDTATNTDSDFHIANARDESPHAAHTAHVTNGGQSATNLCNLDKIKVQFKNFQMKYKILTPKAQLQAEINEHLDIKGEPVNVFFQEVHIRSETQIVEFGMNTPYVLIITLSRVNYINGDFYHPPTHCTWEKMKQITVKVNNIVVSPVIENSKDAYFHTRKALHLSDSEPMFVPYKHYEDGNAFVVYELNPTEDSNLKVLPKEMKKNL